MQIRADTNNVGFIFRATPRTPSKAGMPLGRSGSSSLNPGSLNPGGAEQDTYFAELLGHPLERLSKEPQLLAEDQAQLRRQMQVGILPLMIVH